MYFRLENSTSSPVSQLQDVASDPKPPLSSCVASSRMIDRLHQSGGLSPCNEVTRPPACGHDEAPAAPPPQSHPLSGAAARSSRRGCCGGAGERPRAPVRARLGSSGPGRAPPCPGSHGAPHTPVPPSRSGWRAPGRREGGPGPLRGGGSPAPRPGLRGKAWGRWAGGGSAGVHRAPSDSDERRPAGPCSRPSLRGSPARPPLSRGTGCRSAVTVCKAWSAAARSKLALGLVTLSAPSDFFQPFVRDVRGNHNPGS